MQPTNIRVRDLLHSKNEPETHSNGNEERAQESNMTKNDESKLCSVLQSLENMMASFLHSQTNKPSQQIPNIRFDTNITREFEPRDRFFMVNLPEFLDQ
jgi:hypothetical protein